MIGASRPKSGRWRVLVGYDSDSAATPTQLAAAAGEEFQLGFLVGPELSAPLRRLLGVFGEVIDADDLPFIDAWRADGIVCFGEPSLLRTAQLAAHLQLPFTDEAVLRAATDKSAQRSLLHRHGVDRTLQVRLTGLGDLEDAFTTIGGPAVLKPVHGTGSRDTRLIANRSDISELATTDAQTTEWVLEEMLVGAPRCGYGDYVSLEAVVRDGTVEPLAIVDKFPLVRPFRETGGIYPSPLGEPDRSAVIELGSAAVQALGITWGLVHVEVKLTADGPRIIEVNPRLGGLSQALVLRASGRSLAAAGLRCAVGQSVDPPGDHSDGVAWSYAVMPPMSATRVLEIRGVDEVRAMTAVETVEVRARPGSRLDWRNGWRDRIVLFGGHCAHQDDVLALRAQIDDTVQVSYGTD